jgi:iron-sulfur cluster repair protein YtfE (RIC family)
LETRITDLLSQLKAHFAEEESGGCLEEAVSRCPSTARETETVLKEHHQLDQLLCCVLSQVSNLATPAEIQASWQAFYAKIRAHEASETRLLRMAFGHESAESDIEEE